MATVKLKDNRILGDVLTVSYGSAAFSDKNVGTRKAVAVDGIALAGADAANYRLAATTAATTASITPKTLTGSITAANKIYDGTTAATIESRSLAGVLAGETVSYVGGTAAFGSKSAGTAKTVTAGGLSLSGPDAGNYKVNLTAKTTATITPLAITVTADPQFKTQGSPDPVLTYQVSGGTLAKGDVFSGYLTRARGETIGTYAIRIGTLTAGGNYNVTFVGSTLSIVAPAASPTAIGPLPATDGSLRSPAAGCGMDWQGPDVGALDAVFQDLGTLLGA